MGEIWAISIPGVVLQKCDCILVIVFQSLYFGDCIPDCISVVVLKNCKPEISYILAELFNMCLKESSFSDCWKVSSMVPVFL